MSIRRPGPLRIVWYLTPLVIALGACSPGPVVVPGTPAPPVALNDASVSGAIQNYNTAQVRVSELASTKAANAEVRTYAQTLSRDHNQLNQQLSGVLTTQNIQPASSSLSAEIQQGEGNTMAALQQRSGADFDREFLDREITHHRWIIEQLDTNMIPAAQNTQLRNYLTAMRTTEAAHLQEAERLRGLMGG